MNAPSSRPQATTRRGEPEPWRLIIFPSASEVHPERLVAITWVALPSWPGGTSSAIQSATVSVTCALAGIEASAQRAVSTARVRMLSLLFENLLKCNASVRDRIHDFGIELVLDHEHPRGKALGGIAWLDRHASLRDDRPAIIVGVHKVYGCAGLSLAGRQHGRV